MPSRRPVDLLHWIRGCGTTILKRKMQLVRIHSRRDPPSRLEILPTRNDTQRRCPEVAATAAETPKLRAVLSSGTGNDKLKRRHPDIQGTNRLPCCHIGRTTHPPIHQCRGTLRGLCRQTRWNQMGGPHKCDTKPIPIYRPEYRHQVEHGDTKTRSS